MKNYEKLSKQMSYALRHKPEEFGIVLDEHGYVNLEIFAKSIGAEVSDVLYIVNVIQNKPNQKKRFEISYDGNQDFIRACYGHSTEQIKVEYQESTPPSVLYHGTRKSVESKILAEGLKPMDRQYVHLSEDLKTANIVAKRWNTEIVIFKVDTLQTLKDGVKFYKGNDTTWLCDYIAPKYLSYCD